ncbi:DUF1775 domain-containing protein [Streptomyces sp. 8N706]|uniref:DUF1775 domain-containing protein n=1 Tax=Streptomyces sp. 8N706 TaxID=3457416 RepID=UPI003FD59A87
MGVLLSRTTRLRSVRRLAAVTAILLSSAVALAAPASAHVEVSAEDARALAKNVTLTFNAESESSSAGITKLQVFLPDGIAPEDITYGEGPKGWKMARGDDGYTVSGPAVSAGQDAEYSVTVRQLPETDSLAFKTLQSYSDGRVDRWIELKKSSGHGHGNSAPALELKPAAPGAKPAGPSPSTDTASSAPAEEKASPSKADDSPKGANAAAKKEDDGTPAALPVAVGALLLAALGGLWWWKRRSAAGES